MSMAAKTLADTGDGEPFAPVANGSLMGSDGSSGLRSCASTVIPDDMLVVLLITGARARFPSIIIIFFFLFQREFIIRGT